MMGDWLMEFVEVNPSPGNEWKSTIGHFPMMK